MAEQIESAKERLDRVLEQVNREHAEAIARGENPNDRPIDPSTEEGLNQLEEEVSNLLSELEVMAENSEEWKQFTTGFKQIMTSILEPRAGLAGLKSLCDKEGS